VTTSSDAIPDAVLFGNRFATQEVPSREFPETGMTPLDAMRLVAEDLVLEGDPARNLATFVTTWMEPEAQRIIAENLHRNFIDHAEYPRTAEIEQRCTACLPICSTHPVRPLARVRRARRRRSCSAGSP
jgi:glutamate decarboxylase